MGDHTLGAFCNVLFLTATTDAFRHTLMRLPHAFTQPQGGYVEKVTPQSFDCVKA